MLDSRIQRESNLWGRSFDMGLFDGKVVIVTGAGQGIGRAEALQFAKAGACVVVNDVGAGRDGRGTSRDFAKAVADEIVANGGRAMVSTQSVADESGADAIINGAMDSFGRVDVLVNNAGILRDRTLLKLDDEDWDSVHRVHLRGSFCMTRAFGRALAKQGVGDYAIVNTTSRSGLLGQYGQSNYGAAKAGIWGLTRVSALELQKLGCRVNAIAPIAVTRMTEELPLAKEPEYAAMLPEHVAPVVLWLSSRLSRQVRGRTFGVHGRRVFEYKMVESIGVEPPDELEEWTPEALAHACGDISYFGAQQPDLT